MQCRGPYFLSLVWTTAGIRSYIRKESYGVEFFTTTARHFTKVVKKNKYIIFYFANACIMVMKMLTFVMSILVCVRKTG